MSRVWVAAIAISLTAVLLLFGADAVTERLSRHRNLGKAFYENPTTQAQAVEEFRKALELAPKSARERLNFGLALLRAAKTKEGMAELEAVQKLDPKLPHTWFNLGIQLKKLGEFEPALKQFERMVELVPDEPISHYNLGVLYKLVGNAARSLRAFETAARLDAQLAAAHFQLFNAYRQSGRAADAARELAVFQQLKKQQEGAAVPEDVDWSYYAEIYEIIDPKAAADDTPPPRAITFAARRLEGNVDAKTAGLTVVDADADGRPDLAAWSASGLRLFRNGQVPMDAGEWKDVISVAPGDFDNDGRTDLCVVTARGPVLLRNTRTGFVRVTAALPEERFEQAVWLDYDHDYDLDLVLLGTQPVLLRNQGTAGFADKTAEFPFVAGRAVDGAAFRLVADGKGIDLVVAYADRAGVVYRDQLGGKFQAEPSPAIEQGARSLSSHDIDNDGWLDLVFRAGSGTRVLRNRNGGFAAPALPLGNGAFAVADLTNRGAGDVIVGGSLKRNLGLERFGAAETPTGIVDAAAWAIADFDGDGRMDLAAVANDGSLHRLLNQTAGGNGWMRVKLTGVKNLRLAPGAEVEVKAGVLYQKKTYDGTPLVFGLRSYKEADTVRITWPNGLIQNEPHQPAGKPAEYKEAQRLSGSCPMIWTWDGTRFRYITDVLGVAPLGASAGDGTYFPVDNDEFIQIPGEALALRDGQYEVRITEELSEVSYLDQVRLIAVDHPAAIDIFTNDKWKSPPFPEFRLFGVSKRRYPRAARDDAGRDVLSRILASDGRYVDGFARTLSGVAGIHALELDFGPETAPGSRAVLVLNGWVDWADGSTFRAQSQTGASGLVTPYLEVKDAQGRWQKVIEDMGMPAGKPKTIVVDLSGKFLSAAREVRIVTNLCVYWDQIFLSEDTAAPTAVMTELAAGASELLFRGFSKAKIHPERKQPEMFFYDSPRPVSMWNPTPGFYTRYGEVRELISEIDDRLVIMGAGDELRLRFDAARLPALPQGWRRDFLLHVDGWAKDRDPNTAYSQTVEPLPFHRMSAYPYRTDEEHPHPAYRRVFNVRPALRLLRPLQETMP